LSDVSGSISIETYVGEDARFSWWSLNPSTSYFVGFTFERGSSTLCQWRTGVTVNCPGNVTSTFMGKLFLYGSPASNITFEIKNVKVANEGPYKVTFRENIDPTTAIERSGVLTVLDPPEITPIQNTTVRAGETITLTCAVAGNPTPSVSWSKTGSGHSTGGNVFTKAGATKTDTGQYVCTAVNTITGNTQTRTESTYVMVKLLYEVKCKCSMMSNVLITNQKKSTEDATLAWLLLLLVQQSSLFSLSPT
ncbi:predicted protein, partial [Nematostella vectensis]